MDYRRCINFLLTVAQHDVFLTFSENLSKFDITPGQYGVLACLWRDETLTPKEISQILRVENSTISGVLDRMEKRGLVNRVLDPHDRRSIRVEVSEKGLKIKNGVQKMIEDLNDVVLQDFSAKERKELLDLLSRVGHVTTDE